MQVANLEVFQNIAEQMRGGEAADWQWLGAHLSQRHFGITEARARAFAARHGGEAKKMAVA